MSFFNFFSPHDEPPSRLFYFDDISMDGMTTLHLAAKYSPKSLDMVLRFLRRSKLDYSNLIKAGDHQVPVSQNAKKIIDILMESQ